MTRPGPKPGRNAERDRLIVREYKAKTQTGMELAETLGLSYGRVFQILRAHGYHGKNRHAARNSRGIDS